MTPSQHSLTFLWLCSPWLIYNEELNCVVCPTKIFFLLFFNSSHHQLWNIRTVLTALNNNIKWHHVAPLLSRRLFLKVSAHAPSAISAFSNPLSVFLWAGENDPKTLCVNANFFFLTEKKVAFSKWIRVGLFHLKTQLLVCEYHYRPHVFDENDHRKCSFLKTLSRVLRIF